MNDERDTTDMERLVSETYRAAATERAPEHLGKKILHAAAQEPKKQPQLSTYGFAASWMRPAAWAATISLCLAIVLEITEAPELEVSRPAVSTVVPAADIASGRREEAAAEVAAEPEMLRANKMRAPAAIAAERKAVAADNRVIASDNPAEVSIMEQLKTQDRDTLQEAEIPARKRTAPNLQKEVPGIAVMAITATTADKQESDAAKACDSESRETAESWFTCIQMLHDTGRAADAASEYNEFTLKYPDYEPD